MIVRNRLLSKLGQAEWRRLRPKLEPVVLREDDVIYAPREVVSHIYFPGDAVASMRLPADSNHMVEVAMEGNESAIGMVVHLGGMNDSGSSVVRNPGNAMRLDVRALPRVPDPSDRLSRLLLQYVHALFVQVAQTGVCHQFHHTDARLARWLLMTQDRSGSTQLFATQASIANMLGVRRSTVTTAASGFQRQRIIDYSRGHLEILDRAKLGAAACSCYAIINTAYDGFLG